MVPLALAFLVLLSPARAETDAERGAREAAALSRAGALATDPATARARAGAAFDGETPADDPTVSAEENQRRRRLRLTRAEDLKRERAAAPPAPRGDEPPRSKLSTGLILAGGAALGALQGAFSAGLVGALAGGLLGLGAAWLYTKGHHAAAFGATAGGIIGAAVGGPIGGIIGAVVGAGIGFLVGKLFGI